MKKHIFNSRCLKASRATERTPPASFNQTDCVSQGEVARKLAGLQCDVHPPQTEMQSLQKLTENGLVFHFQPFFFFAQGWQSGRRLAGASLRFYCMPERWRSSAHRQGQRPRRRNPDHPGPGRLVQLIQWDPRAFQGQQRNLVPPGFPGSPPGGTCLEDLSREASRRHA